MSSVNIYVSSVAGRSRTESPLESIFSFSSCSSSLKAANASVRSPTDPLVVSCLASTALSSPCSYSWRNNSARGEGWGGGGDC